jgi:hypothetical protein
MHKSRNTLPSGLCVQRTGEIVQLRLRHVAQITFSAQAQAVRRTVMTLIQKLNTCNECAAVAHWTLQKGISLCWTTQFAVVVVLTCKRSCSCIVLVAGSSTMSLNGRFYMLAVTSFAHVFL